ncbi:multifunctional CCA addition/repair protein [Acinetobacter qingfengensis]|uniref:Multifunctional CCA protein n=1 Tax=Acinetobacter qingfengensis TaxID=1262585 RepID=A0A1E7RC78_9GAMM|nr:multifunctional CCA addition/repair protein [Acinetobacter qingfengensis]KAA8734850.1 multifunctional CCA addition/repair protein [Acinetobacter qingfengensis]OEY96893.1 multifunctional CCA tRNA nucleotidyl transferase/2'3'-cyclic phosphodiesterase/2'nucleotidase/phosphatase [Acinetobacter qingfengensis]
MQIYLVGGAVRDHLLQRPILERDYVVVGATPEQLIQQGFQTVGKDFPVFLHPDSKEEYALARTERKNGHGYQGFDFFTSPEITLEQDLYRRDLTINAMAMDEQGHIIDPYGGQQDLEQRILRHVSEAFIEDPLRVLRIARFAARYHRYGFQIADETLKLMTEIAKSGELQHLSAERIWKETVRALGEDRADIYFEVLRDCKALEVLFPEVDALFGVPQRPEYHPEIDCGVHTLMSLQQACLNHFDPIVRFAVLCHDLGKALTPDDVLPRHIMHEQRGIEPVKALCKRLKVPTEYQQLAVKVCEYHLLCHQLFSLKASTIWKLLKNLDVLRKQQTVIWFSQACLCDARGRLNFENKDYPQMLVLQQIAQQIHDTKITIPTTIKGSEIGIYLTEQRVALINALKHHFPH